MHFKVIVLLIFSSNNSYVQACTRTVTPASSPTTPTASTCVPGELIQAQAHMFTEGTNSDGVQSQYGGTLFFEQKRGDPIVKITGDLNGDFLTVDGQVVPPTKHAMHIHEYGRLDQKCSLYGPHYNPTNTTHGDRTDTVRHVGDMGNVPLNTNGILKVDISDPLISLEGPYSIIGRTASIHQFEDAFDNGLIDQGDGERRIICGVIGITSENYVNTC